jgi:glutaredoxin
MAPTDRNSRQIKLYRISTPEYECPWGLRAVKSLQYRELDFEDIKLRSRAEIEKFIQKYRAVITPQIFCDAKLLSGYVDLADPELTQIARSVAILRRVKCQITHAKFMRIARHSTINFPQK